MSEPKERMVSVTFFLPASQAEELRRVAAALDVPQARILRRALEAQLEKEQRVMVALESVTVNGKGEGGGRG